MKSASFLAASAVAIAGVSGQVVKRQQGSLPPVTVEGNAFYAGGERFYVRGVAYQPGGAADAQDPLLDMDNLRRDVARFEELGINTIRIYTIDNSENHDEAMALLDEAGIYLALDANTPDYSLNRESLDSLHASYNEVYLQNVFATIDAFAGYSNLLLFFSGNEVINARNNTNAAPYIKAVTRDMKNYINTQADRFIPVGYSSADVAENIEAQALYFACGEDENARSDFFAFNDYSWCDPSSFTQSGWDQKVRTYSNYSLPLFLSEFGCITNTREWNEIEALYSTNMTGVYSGGLAYEYTLEENGYGLVELSNGEVTPNDDFRRLKEKYAATPNPSGDGGARTSVEYPDCPARSEEWNVGTTLLPEMPVNAKQYLEDGAGRGQGLGGDGSQWAGTPSETDADLSNGVEVSENDTGSNNNTSSGSSGSSGSNGGSSNNNNNNSSSSESGDAEDNAASIPLAAASTIFASLMAAVFITM
ncbi:glycoside hydrolase family 72 protein [Polychaeton citri CBS 116435]|uniref:1,3-beta-glucanosyltransferase n=1 Tax=Polychaeton citri CBS 116435 TaxID=1314669 RepID=A0A9P4QH06_9PEZI|nr:glycoside hydrolase family 72 protein [Polychaeton citri CBS 116435]